MVRACAGPVLVKPFAIDRRALPQTAVHSSYLRRVCIYPSLNFIKQSDRSSADSFQFMGLDLSRQIDDLFPMLYDLLHVLTVAHVLPGGTRVVGIV